MTSVEIPLIGRWMAASLVRVRGQRAVVLDDEPGEVWRYRVRLADGTECVVTADEVAGTSSHDCWQRLSGQGFGEYGGRYDDAVADVAAAAVDARAVRVTPGLSEFLDALALVKPARDEAEENERRLMFAAKQAGATWEQIGLMLGYPSRSAKQAASQRWKTLGGPAWEQRRILSGTPTSVKAKGGR